MQQCHFQILTAPTRMQRRELAKREQLRKATRAMAGGAMASCLLLQSFSAFAASQKATATADVRIREEQSADSKALASIRQGDEVTVLESAGEWIKVKTGSVIGYIYGKYLVKGPAPESEKKTEAKAEPKSESKSESKSEAKAEDKKDSKDTKEAAAVKVTDIDKADLIEFAPKLVGHKLSRGMESKYVTWLQSVLTLADCYIGRVNGVFDDETEKSVKLFQHAFGVKDDGVVGKRTMSKLFDVIGFDPGKAMDAVADDEEKTEKSPSIGEAKSEVIAESSDSSKADADKRVSASSESQVLGASATANGIELIDWYEGGNAAFLRNKPALIYDVWTGKSYYMTRFGGSNHADVIPCSQEDTNILFSTYDYNWKWDPRPVYVTVGGRTFVGSINGMPHGTTPDPTNGMDGQVCIHLLNSKTHNGNTSFEKSHQKALLKAWEAAQQGQTAQ